MRQHDDVAILEAAYRLDRDGCDDRAWLLSVLEAARGALDAGFGVFGYRIDARDLAAVKATTPTLVGGPPGSEEVLAQIEAALRLGPEEQRALGILGAPETAEQLYAGSHALLTVSSTLGRAAFGALSPVQRWLAPFGIADLLALKTIDVDRRGVVLGAALPKPTTPTRARTLAFSRVAAHLSAALRLREQVDDPLVGADAIFAARGDGHVLAHLDGEAREEAAREALRRAAAAIARARGRLRRDDPEAAIASWPSLVDGRWTLLDCFDRDGRRFLVARRNEPRDPKVRAELALTPRERQVAAHAAMGHGVRLIAYELGLSPATVCEQLGAAMRKLGVKTRAALAAAHHLSTAPDATVAVRDELTVLASPRRARAGEASLSPGERAVIALVERGLSNAQIAESRGTSTHTVANQVARVFRKLGVGSRAELATWSAGA